MGEYRMGPKKFSEYCNEFPNLRLEQEDGIILITMHDGDGGPMLFGGNPHPHGQLTEAFYEISRDTEARAVILTGAGGAWIDGINFGEGLPPSLPATAFVGMDNESCRFLMNQINISVPMIAAVDGRAYVQSQLALLCDIVIASPTAEFADLPHYPQGVIPGDGAHIVWPLFLGPGRGRYFLLTGEKIGAEEAKRIGFVQEIVPTDQLVARAWELARLITAAPPMTARYTRAIFTQDIRRKLVDDLPSGVTAEILAMSEYFPSGVRK